VYVAAARFVFGHAQSPPLAYFDHLAAAFLRGELFLASPPAGYDLTNYAGRWYVPFPPLPALLMLPFVAVLGIEGFNTAVFSAGMGALNVVLVYALVRGLHVRGWSVLGRGGAVWLSALFGFGCVHWLLAVTGTVWFVSQICTVTFVLLAALLAVGIERTWLAALGAGVALALAMLARPHIAVAWPMLIGILLQRIAHNDHGFARIHLPMIMRLVGISAAPMFVALGGLLLYNYARFNDYFDFGYLTQNVAPTLLKDLRTYGQFHPHFWARNAWAMLAASIYFNPHGGMPYISPYGLGLLFVTPALVYLVRAVRVLRAQFVRLGAWVALLVTLVVLLSYYNTGAAQFGYRFSLDVMPEVMVLLTCSLPTISWLLRVLILLSIAINAYGVQWFVGFTG
jgi:hypothetical protein